MKDVIIAILNLAIPSLLSVMVWQMKRMLTSKESDSSGIKLLLRAQMKEYHSEYMERGNVTSEELAEYREIYKTYHNLHGNGQGTVWMDDIEKLERKGE